jgi:hypothetical protein
MISALTFKRLWYERIRETHGEYVREFECAFQEGVKYALTMARPSRRQIVFTISNTCYETLGPDLIIEIASEFGFEFKRSDPQNDVHFQVSAVIIKLDVPFKQHAVANAPTETENEIDESGMDRDDGSRDEHGAGEPKHDAGANDQTIE